MKHNLAQGPFAKVMRPVGRDAIAAILAAYEDEIIVVPDNLWRIDISEAKFRLDRQRH